MNLSNLTSSDLKKIAALLAKRDALAARVAKINEQLAAYESGPVVRRAKAAKAPARRPSKRRKVKEAVLELLQAAGKEGATVREIAAELGLTPNRIYTWFYGTGKKIREIKKIGEAKYAWAG